MWGLFFSFVLFWRGGGDGVFWQATCDFPSGCELLSEVHAQLALGQCVHISVPVTHCNTVTVFSGYQFLADNEALQDSPSTSCFPGSLVSQPKHPTRVLGTELLLARVHGGIWRPCCNHFGRKTEKEKSLLSPAEADLHASQILLCVCNLAMRRETSRVTCIPC